MTTSHFLIALVVLLSPQILELTDWNAGVKNFPEPPKVSEPAQKFAARCKLDVRRAPPGERALANPLSFVKRKTGV